MVFNVQKTKKYKKQKKKQKDTINFIEKTIFKTSIYLGSIFYIPIVVDLFFNIESLPIHDRAKFYFWDRPVHCILVMIHDEERTISFDTQKKVVLLDSNDPHQLTSQM